ncbi:MAG TPA: hypothetical protein VKR78_00955 [Acidimicrobiales bacterium]|jgi:cell division septum initiation protein DivIVA|nr:hypothetical protein [Acidimicrobiales bacterium]
MTTTPPDRVTRPDFGISVRGYDRAQVDSYFGRVVEWLAEAENRAILAERIRESLVREVTELRASIAMLEDRAGMPAPQSMNAFSERMGQVMESALQAAQELRAEAEREAKERRESAAKESDQLLASARAEADQIVKDSRRAQRAMEESIADLRSSRVEAVEVLLDLQRQIAAIVGLPEPSIDGDGQLEESTDHDLAADVDGSAESEHEPDEEGESDDDVEDLDPLTTTGVLVTTAPTVVQPAVARTDGSESRRRRSA